MYINMQHFLLQVADIMDSVSKCACKYLPEMVYEISMIRKVRM